MAGPEDEMAAGADGRGHLRASHADREYVIDTLKAAFVQGRLVKDEFDLRVRQTFAARTYAELAALTADLPAGMIEPQSPREHPSVPDQQPVSKTLMWGACVIMVAAVGAMATSFLTNEFLLLVAGVLAILIAAPVAGTLMLDSWREKRSGGQLPPRAARGDQALEGKRDGGIGNDLTLSAARRDVRSRRMKIGVPVAPVSC
jgi:hypothetical protein